jgi:hypothetical protein
MSKKETFNLEAIEVETFELVDITKSAIEENQQEMAASSSSCSSCGSTSCCSTCSSCSSSWSTEAAK